MDDSKKVCKSISVGFKHFRRDIHSIWEDLVASELYLSEVHNLIKKNQIVLLKLPNLDDSQPDINFSKNRTFGVLHRIRTEKIYRNALIDSISCFENYLSFLVYTVYIDRPEILRKFVSDENEKREIKLMNIILDSDDKEQIIEKIIEEKIRKMLYGNPLDFFIKDKARLHLEEYFETNRIELNSYIEINARRNIFIHNKGRVDSKYLSEVEKVMTTSYTKNQVAKLDIEYIKKTINTLKILASIVTVIVFQKTYKDYDKSTQIQKEYKKRVIN